MAFSQDSQLSHLSQQSQSQLVDEANCITLKGSVDIIVEFFQYSINSILYQRGIYPPKVFSPCKHYNLQMMITTDKELQTYLNNVLTQLQEWLLNQQVNRLVLVIASQSNPNNILERWQFNIITEKNEWKQNNNNNENSNTNNNNHNNNNNNNNSHENGNFDYEMKNDFGNNSNANKQNNKNSNGGKRDKVLKNGGKPLKEIQREIQAIMRQITSSVTFLPLLDGPCSFDLLFYTNKQCNVPRQWEHSDPKFINNSENVKLRSFSTRIHKIDSLVSYKVNDDDEDDDDGDLEL